MSYASPTISNSAPGSKPVPIPTSTDHHESGDLKLRVQIEQFESVLKLRDTHPFGPKGALARWLNEFSEMDDHGTCPPPMA
ncbi:MAG TPA: hypothetical protein PKN33_01205 [Phycisphaerae bacterium]|nr:hypothetical protein [Phycisphaerae bacterium]